MLTIFFSSLAIGVSGALVPGPVFTLVVAETARRRAIAGPFTVAGHTLLEFFVVVSLCFGLGTGLANPRVFTVVTLLGAVFLLRIAFSMPRIRQMGPVHSCVENGRNLMLCGVALSVSNPYFLFWWVTIVAGYVVLAQEFGVTGLFFFYFGHVLSDFAWYTVVSSGVAMGRRFITDRVYRGLMRPVPYSCSSLRAILALPA